MNTVEFARLVERLHTNLLKTTWKIKRQEPQDKGPVSNIVSVYDVYLEVPKEAKLTVLAEIAQDYQYLRESTCNFVARLPPPLRFAIMTLAHDRSLDLLGAVANSQGCLRLSEVEEPPDADEYDWVQNHGYGNLWEGRTRSLSVLELASKCLRDYLMSEDVTAMDAVLAGVLPEEGDLLCDLQKCASALSNAALFYEETQNALTEIGLCYGINCYSAVMGLSRKVLEITLMQRLTNMRIEYRPKAMVGELLKALKSATTDTAEYLPPGLEDIANIINNSCIPALHPKENIPVPSKNQVSMVIYGILDMLERTCSA